MESSCPGVAKCALAFLRRHCHCWALLGFSVCVSFPTRAIRGAPASLSAAAETVCPQAWNHKVHRHPNG
uniref:Secreted protein n=1 Tax=Knipowitschia caucasica TaxID=637954 RepID=A0AAV2MDE1_KNICA